ENMLIDAGNNTSGEKVVNYIKRKDIDTINYLIGSHPHADHIGGLDDVINSFKIGKIYMPQVNHTTKTYEDVLLAIDAKGKKIKAAKQGLVILEDKELRAEILSPISNNYENLNNWSVVVKLDYKNISFLFTGDAEEEVEKQLINSGINIKSQVYKVAHHGSDTSNNNNFLEKINPQVSVISVGSTNSYGHPSSSVINELIKIDSNIFRTDKQGTIIISSDGETTIDYNKEPLSLKSKEDKNKSINNNVEIINVDLKKEIVKIKNNSGEKIDISGWRLLSVKGEQEFYFPEGTIINQGEIIKVVSGRNAEEKTDAIIWTKAYIWNNEGDSAKLFNVEQEVISSY
ncbi:MAG: MBL fold metallo-hydrolase, partial [Bacillota bacterium]